MFLYSCKIFWVLDNVLFPCQFCTKKWDFYLLSHQHMNNVKTRSEVPSIVLLIVLNGDKFCIFEVYFEMLMNNFVCLIENLHLSLFPENSKTKNEASQYCMILINWKMIIKLQRWCDFMIINYLWIQSHAGKAIHILPVPTFQCFHGDNNMVIKIHLQRLYP